MSLFLLAGWLEPIFKNNSCLEGRTSKRKGEKSSPKKSNNNIRPQTVVGPRHP